MSIKNQNRVNGYLGWGLKNHFAPSNYYYFIYLFYFILLLSSSSFFWVGVVVVGWWWGGVVVVVGVGGGGGGGAGWGGWGGVVYWYIGISHSYLTGGNRSIYYNTIIYKLAKHTVAHALFSSKNRWFNQNWWMPPRNLDCFYWNFLSL